MPQRSPFVGVTRAEASRLELLLEKFAEERWLEPEQREQAVALAKLIGGWLDGDW